MRSTIFIIGMTLVVWSNVYCQQKESTLISNSVVPVDNRGELSSKFKSLLKSELEGARIVALGEASHEDGSTFEQKTKLVKFLHEELDFRVLAFEYGFYGNYKANQLLSQGADPDSVFRYSGWAKSEYAYPIYQYITQTHLSKTPLNYAGFDSEKVPDGIPNIKGFIKTLNSQLDEPISQTELVVVDSLIGAVYGGMNNALRSALTYEQRSRAKNSIEKLIRELEKSHKKFEGSHRVWLMALYTLRSMLLDEKSAFAGNFWNIVRDKHMAQRIIWLADTLYKNEKIILWGASGHFARNMIEIERSQQPGDYGYYPFYQSGDWLYQHFGDAYYAMAFVAGGGNVGTIYPEGHKFKAYEEIRILDVADNGSFEFTALQTGEDFLFASLRNAPDSVWMKTAFTAYPLGYQEDYAPWNLVFDGFYFIREMKPDRW